ncbi:hypothetical protein LSG31_17045 [Fodinisporobacter ferrooxydans]|uniref:RNA-binding protein n=1 Tax=Fodinisporobacter ferrooxydans TaxID=2901836 RepID=A0ABY4CGT7_9BACL|nr:hypothetical protein LSG31_17045 [Alicyclobacillaceae bacterium MYW30-H2]
MNAKKQPNKNNSEIIKIRKQIRNGKDTINLFINIELKPANINITNRPIVKDTNSDTNRNTNRNRNNNTNAGNGGSGGGGGINGGGGGGTFGGGGGGVSVSRF